MKTQNTIVKIFFSLALITSTGVAMSQPINNKASQKAEKQNDKRENIEAQKIAFITKKLNLTPTEAQQFWPVYNQYSDKMQENRKKRRQDFKEAKASFDDLSDKEVEQLVDNEMTFRQKEIDLQKEYHIKFKAILPIKKVARLYEAEEQFKRFLLNELKDKPPVKN